MTDKIRTAIIGAGYIADWHAAAIKATGAARITAVVDPSTGAAQALADRHGATVFTSLADLIAAGNADAVHICTPPQLHRDLAIEALNGGLHTLVEKPVALSCGAIKEVAAAAKSAGKLLTPGHNFLGIPAYGRLKREMEGGELGRITSAEINWHFPLAPLRSGPFGLWMLRDPRNLLLELGPHLFAFAVDLFGPPEIRHLDLGKPITLPGGGGTRPQSWRILARAGEVDVTLSLSLVETFDDRSVTLRGSSGLARMDYANDTLTIRRENSSDLILNPFRRELSLSWSHLRNGLANATRQTFSLNRKNPYALSFQGLVEAFHTAIERKTPIVSRFSTENAIHVMDAIDATLAKLPERPAPANPSISRAPVPDTLVVGGTGFIGRTLTRALVAAGRDVRVLSRGGFGPFADLPDRVETMAARLSDSDDLARALAGIRHVFHLGRSLETSWADALKHDVEVTEAIARAALRAGVERFVYTGTIASYDMSDPGRTITEATGFAEDMTDRNLYARAKAEGERRLLALHRTDGLPLVIARPGIVVGEGGPLQHWGIGRWHGAGAVRLWGNGRNILPFVLNDDIADGLVAMLHTSDIEGRSYNLVGEPMLTGRDYFDAIATRLGARIRVASGNLTALWLTDFAKSALKKHALRRPDVVRPSLRDWKSRAHLSAFDNAAPKADLGWSPERDREAFLRRAVDEANLFGF